ncbi:MAG: retropepsin-like aspartic protease [Rubrivivax sp.]|nr:retropepsin-like aspartic protease [Rubrivivax sp.]MDP3222764.1 retropepsin-like aspartic protease [Rubrivivax sp.]
MGDLPGWLKHTTVWLLLGVGLFVGVQSWQAQQQATRFVVDGQTLEIRRSSDGHYHWTGRIGGREIEFLVDTGATGTAIPAALARELGLPVVGTLQSNTAGGVVTGQLVVGDLQLDGGVQVDRLRMAALPKLSSPLLGMDVLGRLRWQQDAGVLRIELQGSRP